MTESLPRIRAASAGIIIIGNEILSGKVRDENLVFLSSALYGMGVAVERVLVIPDDVEVIARAVAEFSGAYDVVVTTGGVGPTHDDVTMAGVARAFGLPVTRHEELAAGIRTWYGERTNAAALKMADLPEGAILIQKPGLKFPPVLVRNVFVLPGIPSFLRDKFEAMRSVLVGGACHSASLYLRSGETEVAQILDEIQKECPGVSIGSYPRVDDPVYPVTVTVDSRVRSQVDEAVKKLRERLPAHSLDS